MARGIIGIVTDSEAVYFGIGIASKFAIGLALVGSVVIGRNLLGILAPYVFGFDEELQQHPVYKSTMAVLTIIAGCYYFISAGFDIWLFNNSSANGYVVIRTVVNWPFAMTTIAICSWYAHVPFQAHRGFPGPVQPVRALPRDPTRRVAEPETPTGRRADRTPGRGAWLTTTGDVGATTMSAAPSMF